MSKDVEFKLDLRGLNELMRSSEMQTIENKALSQVAAQLGDGFKVEMSHPISYIAIGSVRPRTFAARKAQNESNVIDKAFWGVKV